MQETSQLQSAAMRYAVGWSTNMILSQDIQLLKQQASPTFSFLGILSLNKFSYDFLVSDFRVE
jgi:hypothetical protein